MPINFARWQINFIAFNWMLVTLRADACICEIVCDKFYFLYILCSPYFWLAIPPPPSTARLFKCKVNETDNRVECFSSFFVYVFSLCILLFVSFGRSVVCVRHDKSRNNKRVWSKRAKSQPYKMLVTINDDKKEFNNIQQQQN